MKFKDEIAKSVATHFSIPIQEANLLLEIPPNPALGDVAIPCFSFAKAAKKSPVDIAKEAATKIKLKNITIKATGPYLNFFIEGTELIKNVISEVLEQKAKYKRSIQNKETIVIDYSAPNVAKNMGIHNLRSTIIGQALCNLYRHAGYTVIGVNHLGDWGTQFGKLIWALEKWSNPEELQQKGILFLNDMYVKFHTLSEEVSEEEKNKMEDEARAWSKKIEDNDTRAKMWWKLFIDVSMIEYNKIYERLGVTFTETKGESFYIQFLEETLKLIEQYTEISEGALVVPLGENLAPCLLKRSDGGTLYGTRDLAAAFYRIKEYHPKKVLYAVDIAQSNHFEQIFAVLEKVDSKNKDVFKHISFGRLSFPDGDMSTRKGNIVPLKEVLDKAQDKVLSIINEKNPALSNKEQIAEIVGIGAIIFGDLKNDRIHNIIFEWDKVLDFQGETAPYIQYTIARINSILRKETFSSIDYTLLTEPEEKLLAQIIGNFESVLQTAIAENKPHHIARFTLKLAQEFNNYYVKHKILQNYAALQNARLGLITAVKEVLVLGLSLLNIKSPEEM